MARYVTEEILETECIGDSLTKINTNFEDLDTVFKTLSTEGASVTTSSTAPSGPSEGDLWFNGDTGILYVYFNDGNSSQWIEIGGGGGGGTSVTVSSTAPSSPSVGDLWFDDDDGGLSVYYDSTWVGVGGGGSLTVQDSSVTNAKIAFDGGAFAFRNKIINGNFDIWQRGTSSTRTISQQQSYLADRFSSGTYIPTSNSPNGTVTTSRETTTSTELSLFNADYYQRLQNNITSLGTTPLNSSLLICSGILALQQIEKPSQVLGKTVTISFWARASQATKIVSESQIPSTGMWTPTICKTFDLTTQWQKFTHTYTMPTYSQVVGAAYDPSLVNVNQTNPTYTPLGSSALPPLSSWTYQLDIKTYWDLGEWRRHGNAYAGTRPLGFEGTQQTLAEMQAMNNSIITNGYYDIAQVQLEEGPVATPFEQRPIGTELALCQRYYCKSYEQNIASGTASINNGTPNVICSTIDNTLFPCNVSFPATMRTQPSISIYRPSTGALGVIENAVEASPLAVNTIEAGSNGIGLITTSAVGQGGQTYQFHYTASAEL